MLLPDEFEARMRTVAEQHDFPALAEKMIPHAKRGLCIYTTPVDPYDNCINGSHFGGQPSLPADIAWPQLEDGHYLDFILQINLSWLSCLPDAAMLPSKGMLFLFAVHREEGTYLDDDVFHKVIYSPTFAEELRDLPYEVDDEEKIIQRNISMYPVMLMHTAEILQKYFDVSFSEEELTFCEERYDHFSSNDVKHLLLGIQESTDLNHGACEVDSDKVIDPLAEGWQLLFHLGWDEDARTFWGDGGGIYLYIHPDDLAKADFSKVIAGYQSH